MAKFIRRYESTIYGKYRIAYLKYGVFIGLAISLYVLICGTIGHPIQTPDNYGTEAVMLLGIFLSTYLYRNSLPEKLVSLKELMLLGIGMGTVASVVYGLILWMYTSVLFPDWVNIFIESRINVMPDASESEEAKIAVDAVRNYSAGDWAFIGGFRSFVMSILMVFCAAIIFRTEKAPIKQPKK